MKTVLIFNGNEADDCRVAEDGWKWRGLVRDIERTLHDKIEYGEGKAAKGSFQEARDLLFRLMNEAGLSLDSE